MSVCLFVQAFPASGDPTSVSGFFFFFSLSFCLDKSSKQEKEDRQRRNPHKVKNRPGNLGRFPSLHKFSFLLKLDIVTG